MSHHSIIRSISKIMVILILLLNVLILSGCTFRQFYSDFYTNSLYISKYEYKYYLSQRYDTTHTKVLKMFAFSNANKFDINNVSFELVYGTHANVYYGRKNAHFYNKSNYSLSHSDLGEYKFGIYICNGENEFNILNEEHSLISDIENIEGHTLVNIISESQAFSDEYGYASLGQIFTTRERFRHKETIHIPIDYINKIQGSFVIKIAAFRFDKDQNTFIVDTVERISFEYQVQDGIIYIDFYEV